MSLPSNQRGLRVFIHIHISNSSLPLKQGRLCIYIYIYIYILGRRVKSGHCCRMSKYITYNVLWATGQVRPVTVPADVSQIPVLDFLNPA